MVTTSVEIGWLSRGSLVASASPLESTTWLRPRLFRPASTCSKASLSPSCSNPLRPGVQKRPGLPPPAYRAPSLSPDPNPNTKGSSLSPFSVFFFPGNPAQRPYALVRPLWLCAGPLPFPRPLRFGSSALRAPSRLTEKRRVVGVDIYFLADVAPSSFSPPSFSIPLFPPPPPTSASPPPSPNIAPTGLWQ